MNKTVYLALGDSYTIGEGVLIQESFPYQTVQLLRKKHLNAAAPEIIARTGWTTDELLSAMKDYSFLPQYDYVSLLTGVNNQYRGMPLESYKTDFEQLLEKAIGLTGNKPRHVMVLSIPDYSITPFAANTDKEKTAHELEQFNAVNMALATQYKTGYIDVTAFSGEAENEAGLLVADGLHPSAAAYAKWARQVAHFIAK